MMTRAERKELAKRIPWVKFHAEGTTCTGFKSGTPLKALYHKDPEVRAASLAKYTCKNKAHWKFKSLKKSWVPDGDLCWSHLMSRGLYGDMFEEERTSRWFKRNRYTSEGE